MEAPNDSIALLLRNKGFESSPNVGALRLFARASKCKFRANAEVYWIEFSYLLARIVKNTR